MAPTPLQGHEMSMYCKIQWSTRDACHVNYS